MRAGLRVSRLQGVIRIEVSLTEGPSAEHVGQSRETTSICAGAAYQDWRKEKVHNCQELGHWGCVVKGLKHKREKIL